MTQVACGKVFKDTAIVCGSWAVSDRYSPPLSASFGRTPFTARGGRFFMSQASGAPRVFRFGGFSYLACVPPCSPQVDPGSVSRGERLR